LHIQQQGRWLPEKNYQHKFSRQLASLDVAGLHVACLHDQDMSGFFEGRLLSSQSEQFKIYSKSFDWLEKSRPSKKATFVLIMQTG